MVLDEAIEEAPASGDFAQDGIEAASSGTAGPTSRPLLPTAIDIHSLPRPSPLRRITRTYSDEAVKGSIEYQALRHSLLVGRSLSLEEWQAVAYWRAKSLRYLSYGDDIGALSGFVYATYTSPFRANGQRKDGKAGVRPFTWPFYKPDQSKLDLTKFWSFRGVGATRAWMTSRVAAYVFVWSLLAQVVTPFYAASVEATGIVLDPRANDLIQRQRTVTPAELRAVNEQAAAVIRGGKMRELAKPDEDQESGLRSDRTPLSRNDGAQWDNTGYDTNSDAQQASSSRKELEDASPTAGKEPFVYLIGSEKDVDDERGTTSQREALQQPQSGSAWSRLRQGRQPRSQPPLQQKWKPSSETQETQSERPSTQNTDEDAWLVRRQLGDGERDS